jgi:hypothetical protein
MENRRQFFATTAALTAVAACERRRVRLWLADVRRGDAEPWLRTHEPLTYRDVAAERLVLSLKKGDPLCASIIHRAGDLGPGDALLRRRVRNGDRMCLHEQVWIVCRVKVLS